MQAAPAVQVHLHRFAAWNTLVICMSAAATAACGAWFFARGDDLPAWSGGLIAGSLFFALRGAWVSTRRERVRLRWDSQHWFLDESEGRTEEVGPLQVQVMVDAGAWLLLKLIPQAGVIVPSSRWLPVQRRGIEDQWHALRCAAYSPRADSAKPVGLDGGIRVD